MKHDLTARTLANFSSFWQIKSKCLLIIISLLSLLIGPGSYSPARAERLAIPTYTLMPSINYDFNSLSGCPTGWSCTNGELRLSNNTVTLSLPSQFANPDGVYQVSIQFYDEGSQSGGFYVALDEKPAIDIVNCVALGVKPSPTSPAVPGEYYYAFNVNGATQTLRSGIPQTSGLHTITIRVTPYGSYGVLDGVALSFLPSAGPTVNPGGVHRQQKKAHQLRIGQVQNWGQGTVRFDNLSISENPISETYKQINSGTLEPEEVEKYYGSLLTDETSEQLFWTQILDNTDDPDRSWGRPQAQAALVYAFAYRILGGPTCTSVSSLPGDLTNPRSDIHNGLYPLNGYCDKARALLRAMVIKRSDWRWKWLSGATAYDIALAYALVQNNIAASEGLLQPRDSTTARWVITILDMEADFWSDRLYNIKYTPNNPDPVYSFLSYDYATGFSRDAADTSAEDNGTTAMFLGVWSHLRESDVWNCYSGQKTTTRWTIHSTVYGFHSVTLGPNAETDPFYGLSSRTMHYRSDIGKNVLENHDFSPSLNYAFALTAPANVYSVRKLVDEGSFDRNHMAMWNETKNYYSPDTFLYTPPSYLRIYTNGTYVTDPYNVFSVTGRGDWGDDVTWFNNAFAYAAVRDPSANQPLYINLLKAELALRPDYVAFPLKTGIVLHKPSQVTSQVHYDNQALPYITDHAVGIAERHIVAYLIQNTTLSPQSFSSIFCW
jgi:hypothetical protein